MAKLGLIAVLLACTSGCATVMRGGMQKLEFNTDPAGATVRIDDQTYTTPAVVELARKQEHKVTVSRDGYRDITFVLRSTWDGASIPSFILPGGTLWVAVDNRNGADRKFYGLPVIQLEKATEPSPPPLELFPYRGRLLTRSEFENVEREEMLYMQELLVFDKH